MCVQEGVGDPSSGDSGTLLRHAVCSITWCFVSNCICPKRSHMVLLRSVLPIIQEILCWGNRHLLQLLFPQKMLHKTKVKEDGVVSRSVHLNLFVQCRFLEDALKSCFKYASESDAASLLDKSSWSDDVNVMTYFLSLRCTCTGFWDWLWLGMPLELQH